MQEKRSDTGHDDAIDIITPVDFTPPPKGGRQIKWRPRWYHGFVLLALVIAVTAGWFVLTARSVFIDTDPALADIEITEGFAVRVGPRYLMRPGTYQLALTAYGYFDTNTELQISAEQAQTHAIAMQPRPGFANIRVTDSQGQPLTGARLLLDGVDVGVAPLQSLELPPGEYSLQAEMSRYLSTSRNISIEGRLVEQDIDITLDPAWADIDFRSEPSGADIIANGELLGVTPARLELLQGAYEITIKRAGFKAWQDDLQVIAGQDQQMPAVSLEQADGLVFIRSEPGNANVTINGEFRGQTPLEVSLPPGQQHELRLFRTGFETAVQRITTSAEQESDITVELTPVTNLVRVIADPPDAELFVDGRAMGSANQTVELLAASQRIEIRKEGYVAYTTNFTSRPGLDQEIRVQLKTEEQARLESIEPVITSAGGQTLTLMYPSAYTMGSSRREPGRRANETLRDVILQRPFYLSQNLVTNEQFKRFRADHASGVLQGQSLDLPQQPVVQVSWLDAVLYCNWLSEQEGLQPFYSVEDGQVTGFNASSTGYRLPTEAEWEWAARTDDSGNSYRFPWGDTWPPEAGVGNFADESTSAFLGQYLRGYDDRYAGTANVGSFPANARGFFDMGGNVSEWMHDVYGAVSGLSSVTETDPLGPEEGRYRTIKGSAWSHGSIVELRASYRDFGEEPRNDLGFRVARYLE